MNDFLTICEVGLRDGLQNEKTIVSTPQKRILLDGLIDAGLRYIETSSYVRPDAVPQMADSDEMMAIAMDEYGHLPGSKFMGLVFNHRGYDRAIASGCKHIAFGLSVSDTFSRQNSGMAIPKALSIYRELAKRAHEDGLRIRVYLSAAWVCPFEGRIPAERTIAFADEVWREGIDELAVSDTIGYADPVSVGRLMEALGKRLDMSKMAVHLHDTQALGLANASAAISAGVRIVDSSLAGLGGCPYAPGAAGNLATEDLVFLAYKMGMGTGVDFEKLQGMVTQAEAFIEHSAGGRIRAWWESHKQLA
ncbi:MAG: hydroxymethylglutaryl-CoA lyase [Cellvibrionaceae bacterium]|jgi:hydroxymethylglutaryl-CoA lyase